MTREELSFFDGREGRKAYVAVSGNIYDFTGSDHWQNGDHEGAHQAGRDLTEELKTAPHVRAVIERFPVVDTLEESAEQADRKSGKGIKIFFAVAAVAILLVIAALVL